MKQIVLKKENKKAGIVCFGARLSLSSTNIRSVELHYLREYLMNILGRQVDFISKRTRKEVGIEYFKDIQDVDFNDYDEMYIYNATFNLFGGVFGIENLEALEKMYYFNGDIYYFLGDPKMPPVDYSLCVKSRDKDHTYKFKIGNNEYKHIDPEILDNWREKVWKRIKIAFAGKDYPLYVKTYNELNKRTISKDIRKLNEDAEWCSIWLFEYFSVNEKLDEKLKNYKKCENPFELVYFGNNRQNERNKIVKEFYDIPEFRKYFLGYDPELTNTALEPYIKHSELFNAIGTQCLCTLVVGDTLHCNNIRTPRFFEAMLLDVVAFIWDKFDKDKTYIKNEFLRDFVYVSTKEELKEKVNQIKNDPSLYKKIVELERKEILDEFNYMKMGS